MKQDKLNLGQCCVLSSYQIKGIVSKKVYDLRDINIKIEFEYLDKNDVIQRIWVNEVELDFITKK